MLLMENGILKHPRLLGIYKMRHPEYKQYTNDELMNLLGYKYVNGGAKHKYIQFLGNKHDKKELQKYIDG